MVLWRILAKEAQVNRSLLLKLKKLKKKNYRICYHPTHPIAAFQEAIFALRKKIEKNISNGRVIILKEIPNFLDFVQKNPSHFSKSLFWSKDLWNPSWVQELLPFSAIYRLENAPFSQRFTFAKIYLGDYKKYPKQSFLRNDWIVKW